MNDMSADTARSHRVMVTNRRTTFGGAGFNKFNGAGFDGTGVFRAMRVAFECAARQFPQSVHESYYIFAGHSVRIRIVGSCLAQHILQPFSHLRTDKPDRNTRRLTIDLWDENETSIRCYAGSRTNTVWSDVTSMSTDQRFIGQCLPNTLACFDRRARRIVGSIAWSERIFIYERAKPLARLLLEWHNDQHIQMIHGGLVSRHGQGILFLGKSGSGKSTASVACLSAGFDYLGEDYVGLQTLSDGSFMGHSLYNSVFLDTEHLTRFPQFAPYVTRGRPHEAKSVVILSNVFPKRLKRAVPIRVVMLPCLVNASESRIRPASKGEALLALGPSSLIEIPSRGIDSFGKLAQLVEQVPTYWLELGRDLKSTPSRVEEFLSEATRR